MRRPSLLLIVVAPLLLPSFARGDTVILANGQRYEDVIAERTAVGVRVQLAFGEITIPTAQVRDIEKAPNSVAEYRQRKAELIRGILADDARIRALVEPRLEALFVLLGATRQKQKLQRAYQADA